MINKSIMKIFVSHAISDKAMIESYKKNFEPHGITLLIAEHYVSLDMNITSKIEKLIQSCDLALFLLTESGFNSSFVQQEIGYVKSLKKPILQVIQIGVEKKLSGFTHGYDYVPFDPTNPEESELKVKQILIKHSNSIERKRVKTLKLKKQLIEDRLAKEKEEAQKKLGLGILAGVLILGLLTSK